MTFQRREFIPVDIANEAKVKNEAQRKKFLAWLETLKDSPYLFDVNTYLNCFNIRERINEDDSDFFEIIAGKEGMGKSFFAMKKAAIVDPTFDKTRIMYDRRSLFNWIQENFNSNPQLSKTKGKAILLDEGNMFLFSREAMSMDNVDVVKLFTLIRQCNMYIIICIPSFKTVDTYIRTHRADRLTHIRQKANNWRLFSSYNKDGIDVLNDAIKKGVAFDKILCPAQFLYHGGSNDLMPKIGGLDQGDYKSVKADAFMEYVREKGKESKKQEESPYVTMREARLILKGRNQGTIVKDLKEGRLVGNKIGDRWYILKESLVLNQQNVNSARMYTLPISTNQALKPQDSGFIGPINPNGGSKKDEVEH